MTAVAAATNATVAGALAAAMAWSPAPAAAAYRGARTWEGRAAAPRAQPSEASAIDQGDDDLTGTGGPGAGSGGGTASAGGVAASSPPEVRHRLEFSGISGWPDLAMGCFFDPDSRGADRYGRRAVCVETAVPPPVLGPTRIRGRHHPLSHHTR